MSDNNIECLITKLPAEQFNTTLEALVYEKISTTSRFARRALIGISS